MQLARLAAAAPLWALLFCLLPGAQAQIGSDCSDAVPCAGNQDCALGYCRCAQGFVKLTKECVPERGFNETCDFNEQCVDFRLKCSEGRCACVKYFHWDEYSRQCLTLKDLKYMLSDMKEKYTDGRHISERDQVFNGMLWAGLGVVMIGTVLASGCVFYGCCLGRSCCCPHDKMSEVRFRSSLQSDPRGTRVPGATNTPSRLHSGTSQGTGVDYIPALYESTSFNIA